MPGSVAAGILLRARGQERIDIRAPRLRARLKVAAQSVVRKEACSANQGAVWCRQTGLAMWLPHGVPRLAPGDGPNVSERFDGSCPGTRAMEGH